MTLEETIRATVREAVADALDGIEWPAATVEPEEGWRSRIHRVHPDTRLSLSEVADALDVSERTVRRYLDADTPLPSRRGPTGITIPAGELLRWIEDVEEGERFRARRAS